MRVACVAAACAAAGARGVLARAPTLAPAQTPALARARARACARAGACLWAPAGARRTLTSAHRLPHAGAPISDRAAAALPAQRVLVTGAGGQIGSELSLGLAARGARVLATDIRPARAPPLARTADGEADADADAYAHAQGRAGIVRTRGWICGVEAEVACSAATGAALSVEMQGGGGVVFRVSDVLDPEALDALAFGPALAQEEEEEVGVGGKVPAAGGGGAPRASAAEPAKDAFLPTRVVHFAALLSAVSEENPLLGLRLNAFATVGALETARKVDEEMLKRAALARVRGGDAKEERCIAFVPSSIGAFGPSSPLACTPDVCVQRPTKIYGIGKVFSELLGEYFYDRYKLDFRCLRYPGILSWEAPPGGGTTDYAVAIFYSAAARPDPLPFTCFLRPDATLPMMAMPDCLRATIEFLEAPRADLTQCTYNVAGASFSPEELVAEIQRIAPRFTDVTYAPDFRQSIAETWPRVFDDSRARKDWRWRPEFGTREMTETMFGEIGARIAAEAAA